MQITRTSHITKNRVERNGQNIFLGEENVAFPDFIKTAFKSLNQVYPKFYKMDNLCKLAFFGSEVLLSGTDLLQKYNKEDIGLVFLNRASTINTDRDHQLSIDSRENYFPSPAIFVYTLPNIMLGEICLKNKFCGENLLLIGERFNSELLYHQTNMLFEKNKAKVAIAGWADIDGEDYSACLMLVESDNMVNDIKEFTTFAPSNIELIFTNNVIFYHGRKRID
jgi:hypothetical protein